MIPGLIVVALVIAVGLLICYASARPERETRRTTRREYRDADRLLRTEQYRTGDTDVALLRCLIADSKPSRWSRPKPGGQR